MAQNNQIGISTNWCTILNGLYEKHEKSLKNIIHENDNDDIYPSRPMIFEAFKRFDIEDLKVVIVGQDSYHSVAKNGMPLACGLAFSVPLFLPHCV